MTRGEEVAARSWPCTSAETRASPASRSQTRGSVPVCAGWTLAKQSNDTVSRGLGPLGEKGGGGKKILEMIFCFKRVF